MIWFKILALFVYILGVFGDLPERPSNLPCELDDVKCITGMVHWLYVTTIAGVPEDNITTSDPMYQELIEGKLPYVRYMLKKSNIEGLKLCRINEARVNKEVDILHTEFTCPRLHMDGEYDIEGKLLQWQVKGQGMYSIDFTNFHTVSDVAMLYWKKNNNEHVKYKSFQFVATLLGEMDIEIRNLFGGKKELTDPFRKFAKDNGKLLSSLVHDPIIATIVNKYMKNFNKRFEIIPITELLQVKK